MGSVGNSKQLSANKIKNVEREAKSQRNKKVNPISYISNMTFGKLDISKYHEKQFDGKGYITLDWKRMPQTVKQQILSINQSTNALEIVNYGAWGKWIKMKKKA